MDVETGLGVLVHDDRGSGLVLAEQEVLGEDVLDHVLDDAAQRTGAIGHVVAELDDVLLGRIGDFELHLLRAQLVAHAGEHQVDDLGDLLDRQRAEDHGRVDAVEELRAEVLLQLDGDLLLHQLVRALLAVRVGRAHRPEAQARVGLELLGAEVGGHDDDRVAEVDPPTLGVGQVPVLQDLEQDVEDLRMRLLDLVEQDHAVVLAPDGFGQLAALVEADVAGRRPDQPRHVVALHELAHVDLDERVLAAEHELGEGLGQLGLPDAGRAEEDERADRALRVLEARACAADGLRDDADRLLLADDPIVEGLLHVEQALRLFLGDAGDRDAGPHRDDLGDLLLVDRRLVAGDLRLPLGALGVDATRGRSPRPRAGSRPPRIPGC